MLPSQTVGGIQNKSTFNERKEHILFLCEKIMKKTSLAILGSARLRGDENKRTRKR